MRWPRAASSLRCYREAVEARELIRQRGATLQVAGKSVRAARGVHVKRRWHCYIATVGVILLYERVSERMAQFTVGAVRWKITVDDNASAVVT